MNIPYYAFAISLGLGFLWIGFGLCSIGMAIETLAKRFETINLNVIQKNANFPS